MSNQREPGTVARVQCGHCDGKGYVTPRMRQLYGDCGNCGGTGWIAATPHGAGDVTRNSEALKSFVAYCEAHPEQRFWQALTNWSKFGYVLGYDGSIFDLHVVIANAGLPPVADTFFIEGLDGTAEREG